MLIRCLSVSLSLSLSLSLFVTIKCTFYVFLSFLADDLLTKTVSEIEVRRIASDIDNCRVFNTTLAQPSAVHNVFIDGKSIVKGSGYGSGGLVILVFKGSGYGLGGLVIMSGFR